MQFDGMFDLAVGMSSKSKIWKNQKWLWSDFVKRLSEPYYTKETLKEFLVASKEDQGKIKDVGGYVGGYLRAGRRKPENVVHRQLLTLDLDFATTGFWDDYTLFFGNAALLHPTHKHSEESPRYRLIMPVNREVTPDEYCALSRYVAGQLGIELFDNTTFEPNRLMYWQSTPKDQTYSVEVMDGDWLDVDKCLSSYADWRDSSLWPTSVKASEALHAASKKQEDPETKKGIVGAFCRTYDIHEAIENFLSDVYTPTTEGRYTYLGGSTSSGVITYEDKFAFSHHGTDPCSGKLCNAFDLVRIHKFGHLDDDARSESSKTKSFAAMEEMARADKAVKKLIATENLTESRYDFAEGLEPEDDENVDWMTELEVDGKGKYLSNANNINLILANDKRLKGKFKQNDFDGKRYLFNSVPWRAITKPEPVKNVDYSGVRNYIESIYGISGNLKIDDSLALVFEKQSFHPVKDYLNLLEWDGESRVDSLLIDYFGADNNIYSREAIRKMLCGAVARIMRPGTKYDLVLTLVGSQGSYKSTFINKLGRGWFSDSFTTVQGKEAFEQIQGAWLVEIAEMSGFKKAEVESVKHFITKQEDTFRPAYGRTSETYPRQCVFFGTTNNRDFLRDPSGNRRFMPIDVNVDRVIKKVTTDLDSEIDQIWAEAVELYKAGEPLYLSAEAEAIARHEQSSHCEQDERAGMINEYLDKKLPASAEWDKLDIYDRRSYVQGHDQKGEYLRKYVTIAEIWCECLGKEKEDMTRYNTREINEIVRSLPNWQQSTSTRNVKGYGKQKYYIRRE